MGILDRVTSGLSPSGIRMIVAAQEKMGKTTFGCNSPVPLLIPLEVGYASMSCAKTPMISNYEDFTTVMQEITALAQQGQFKFKTLVIDSGTALERHIHDYILRIDPTYMTARTKPTMESAHGGYGRAYNMANAIFENVLKQFDMLAVHAGINIVMTCHVFSSRVSDPTVGEYDSWDILLHSPKNQKTYGKREIVTQWADVIGFIYEPVILMTADKSTMTRGVSANKGRLLALSRTPAYVAGNRFGITGETQLQAPPANGWNNFAEALYKASGIDIYTR